MIRLPELADAVASRHQLNRRAAEQFITSMVDVMNEALRDTKQLRIAGLGTFKVSTVNARESIDVNTGERITIDGRERLSFSPEPSMRDLVNKPFAQFETVVVNDGVDFEEIDRKYQHEPAPEEQAAAAVTPTSAETASEPVEIASAPVEAAQEPAETTLPPAAVEKDIPAEPAPAEAAPEAVALLAGTTASAEEELAPEPARLEEENKIANTNNETKVIMNTKEKQNVDEKLDQYGYPINSTENEELEEIIIRKTNTIRWLVAAVALLLLAGLGGAYFFQQEIKERDNRISHLVAQIQEDQSNKAIHSTGRSRHAGISADRHVRQAVSERERVEAEMAEHERRVKEQQDAMAAEAKKREEAVKKAQEQRRSDEARQAELMKKEEQRRKAAEAEQKKQLEAKRAELARKAEQAKQEEAARKAEQARQAAAARKAEQEKQARQASAKQQVAAKQQAAGSQNMAQYNQDPRVRTGAYMITGVSETVTVREGQTLAGISKAYLGPGMECYVEAINGGIKEVKAGQKIKIPAVKVKTSAKK